MRIVTDTGAMYSPEEGKQMGIDVLPLNVTVNGKTYKEYVDIFSDEYIEIVRQGHIPMSSQPSVGATMELFEEIKNEDTLVINMADGLSGTYQSTVGAKESIENNEKIHVINSMTLCGPQRYLVDKAVALRNEGKTLLEIKTELEELMKTGKSFLIPSDFDFLKRGGRLTPLAATIGGMLKIVPVMTQTDDGRRLEKFAMKKTMKGAIKDIIAYFQENGVNADYNIYITHAGALDKAEKTAEQIQSAMPEVHIEILDLSPAFITQGGPGCVAIQCIKR